MKKFKVIFYQLVIAVILITIAVNGIQSLGETSPAISNAAPRVSKNNVILRALQGNSSVQMFNSLEEGGPGGVITFPDGFGCYKLSGRITWDEDGGPPMYFYKLNCNGRTGYVNAEWVTAR